MERITMYKYLTIFLAIGVTLITILSEITIGEEKLRILKESKDSPLKNGVEIVNRNKSEENDDIPSSNLNEKMKNITELQELVKEKEAKRDRIRNFTESFDKVFFKGRYQVSKENSNDTPNVYQKNISQTFGFSSDRTEGEIVLFIEKSKVYSSYNEKIRVSMRLLDGDYIDNWLYIISDNTLFSDVTVYNSTYIQNFESQIYYGEIFALTDLNAKAENKCKSILKLTWVRENENVEINDINEIMDNSIFQYKMKGKFYSGCHIPNFDFDLEILDKFKDYPKVLKYSVMVTLLAISQIFNTIWMVYKMQDSTTIAKSISLITVLQNIIWNAYGCLAHFFLTVNFEAYSSCFGIPAILYFSNFAIFEIKLLYDLWRIKNIQYLEDPRIMRKKLIQFYFMFYIIMFISLFYVLKFYFSPPYIYIAVAFTWVPQIVFNAIYKNKISPPLINIILTSLNKIFVTIYSRGYEENIFQTKSDFTLVYVCIVTITLEILLLYSQTMFGPRWFIPKWSRYSVINDLPEFDYYKTKDEILTDKPDVEFHDCVICLSPLMAVPACSTNSDFIAIPVGDNQNSDILIGRRSFFSKFTKENMSKFFTTCLRYFLDFHEFQSYRNKKPYMSTPCKHTFHTKCLETWFLLKKECPSCRKDIEI